MWPLAALGAASCCLLWEGGSRQPELGDWNGRWVGENVSLAAASAHPPSAACISDCLVVRRPIADDCDEERVKHRDQGARQNQKIGNVAAKFPFDCLGSGKEYRGGEVFSDNRVVHVSCVFVHDFINERSVGKHLGIRSKLRGDYGLKCRSITDVSYLKFQINDQLAVGNNNVADGISVCDSYPRAVFGLEHVSSEPRLFLASGPKLLGALPENPGESGHSNSGERRDKTVVFVEANEEAPDNGRDDVPLLAMVWGAILALAAYLGIVWTDYRNERH